ncbi:MAG: hypothetical protein IT460_06920 [Planctomycetes bacterium]|nr:hypothetical protein [Planctomycetota bacterium]
MRRTLVAVAPRTRWQEKVAKLLSARRISCRRLAKRLGKSERTVRAWISGTNEPLHETEVVAQLAAALQVPAPWLLNGRDDEPPAPVAARTIPDDLVALIPERFRPLVYAMADPEAAEWMLSQLQLYERARGSRGRAQ